MKNKIVRHPVIILLVIAAFGGLMFFPIQLSDGYTCFYHRIFDPENPVDQHTHEHSDMLTEDHHSIGLMDVYMDKYAFLWWGSLGLIAYCIFRLRKEKTVNSTSEFNGGSY